MNPVCHNSIFGTGLYRPYPPVYQKPEWFLNFVVLEQPIGGLQQPLLARV